VNGQNDRFLHAVIQAQQAQQSQRQEDAWVFTGLVLFAGVIVLACVSRWIWRGGLGRTFPSIRRYNCVDHCPGK
jgi:hypothetical protein